MERALHGLVPMLTDIRNDLSFAVRLIRKTPKLTLAIVLTLALGIGANSVVFSVVRAVILRPLPYEHPEQLVQLWESGIEDSADADWISFPNFKDWSRENHAFQDMAVYRYWPLTIFNNGAAETVLGLQVSDRLFAVLGTKPVVGRTFLPGEDEPGREAVAVISHALWQSRFSGDPNIAGHEVLIDGKPHTIVGVMPAAFSFPAVMPFGTTPIQVQAWIPVRDGPDRTARGNHNFWAIGRLRPDVTLDGASAEMTSIAANLARQYPATNKGLGAGVTYLNEHTTRSVRPSLLILLAAVLVLLLLACCNIANLLLSKAESRRRELSIRQAIGATRSRIFRLLLIESIVLAFLGAAAALVLASFGLDTLIRLAPAEIPRIQQTSIDESVILFTCVVALGAAILFGLMPALTGTVSNVYQALKQSGAQTTAGRSALRMRHGFAAGQIALAVMLLITAGLLTRSLWNVVGLDPGFEADQVVSGIISLSPERYSDPQKQVQFFEDALRRVRALPGVVSAAFSDSVPLMQINDQGGFRIEGRPDPLPGQPGPVANRPKVSSAYFETMGIPLIAGRLFNEHDRADSSKVAIVSDIAARMYWPNENPIGQRLSGDSVNGQRIWREIVGIVRSTRHFGLEQPQKAEIYIPQAQSPGPFMILVVKYRGDADSVIRACKEQVAAIDPQQGGFGMESMENFIEGGQLRRRFQTMLLAGFALLGVLLAVTDVSETDVSETA
jgi:putative ABC transport system permease protein